MKKQSRKKVASDCLWGVFTIAWHDVPDEPGVFANRMSGEFSEDSLRSLRAAAVCVADDLVRRRVMSRADAKALLDCDMVIHPMRAHRLRRPTNSPKPPSLERVRPKIVA